LCFFFFSLNLALWKINAIVCTLVAILYVENEASHCRNIEIKKIKKGKLLMNLWNCQIILGLPESIHLLYDRITHFDFNHC
jgi:hypothetical protein